MEANTILTHSEWLLRIVIAAICGCLIGYERSNRNKEAGIRTHSIISLGAALIMVISKYGFIDIGGADGGRIAAQIVSGVGFLRAGVIFVKHGTVSGLTTAAGMWATSGVGMCVGAGLYDIGISTSILILLIQTLMHRGVFFKKLQTALTVYLEIIVETGALVNVQETFKDNHIFIFDIKTERIKEDVILLEIECNINSQFNQSQFIEEIMQKSYFKRICFS